jgi:hypothetical protein
MWRATLRPGTESICTRARLFMACWNVTASAEDELRFQLRDRTLTLLALNDVMDRAVRCAARDGTRFEFDLSGVDEMESCYSVISARFIRFACQVRRRCRITGLNPRLADILAFFLRRVGCIQLELARPPASVTT